MADSRNTFCNSRAVSSFNRLQCIFLFGYECHFCRFAQGIIVLTRVFDYYIVFWCLCRICERLEVHVNLYHCERTFHFISRQYFCGYLQFCTSLSVLYVFQQSGRHAEQPANHKLHRLIWLASTSGLVLCSMCFYLDEFSSISRKPSNRCHMWTTELYTILWDHKLQGKWVKNAGLLLQHRVWLVKASRFKTHEPSVFDVNVICPRLDDSLMPHFILIIYGIN